MYSESLVPPSQELCLEMLWLQGAPVHQAAEVEDELQEVRRENSFTPLPPSPSESAVFL